jgi:hypothetical protein
MTLISLDSELRPSGNAFVLSGKSFESETIEKLVFRPVGDQKYIIEDVAFIDCNVDSNVAVIRKGVTLKNVIFDNLVCKKPFEISAEAVLDNVVIKGNENPAMVWIRNQHEDRSEEIEFPDATLDVSEYVGELSITGIPVDSVVRNSDLHIVIKSSWLDEIDWKDLGFSPLSYWKLMAKKVSAAKCAEGIFSLPPKSGKNYERSMSELELLKDNGFV